MAGGKLKPFKPGQSGNPSGRPKDSPEMRKLKSLTRKQFSEIADIIVQGEWDEVLKIERSPNASALQKLICKALMVAHGKGDWTTVDRMLDRLIGKPKDDVQVTFMRRVVKKLDGSQVVYTNEPKNEEEE